MSGKGSAPRPLPDYEKYSDNFDLIFGKKNDTVQDSPSTQRPLAETAREADTKTKG